MADQTSRLTPERLAEIEGRAEKATPGPWEREQLTLWGVKEPKPGYKEVVAEQGYTNPEPMTEDCFRRIAEFCLTRGKFETEKDNAEFVANSRTDVPELTREIRRSWAQIEALRAMILRMGGADEAEKQGGEA